MPTPHQTETSWGVLIRTNPSQTFFYERSESINDRKVGDVWIYLPYNKEDVHIYIRSIDKKGDSSHRWKETSFDKLTQEMKAILSLIF